MRITELAKHQLDFEVPRGLFEFNTVSYGLGRTYEELSEARDEMFKGDYKAMLEEMADVVIFAHSVAMHIILKELGGDIEDFERVIASKFAKNFEKYDEAFFNNGWDTATAIRVARHWWNYDLHPKQGEGNDYY